MFFHDELYKVSKSQPNSPAIIWNGSAMSYRELSERSDEIAMGLTEQGIGRGDIVPVTHARGAEWIAYSIGINKAGAAYAPLSPTLPASRRELIFEDISAKLPSDEAMIVYFTSGSTGTPKGVVLSHCGVLEFCRAHAEYIGITPETKAAVHSDVGFDSFMLDTLPVLLSGGTLYIMDDSERASLVSAHKFLMKNKIDLVFFTSTKAVEYMRLFDNKYLKILLTGGEALRAYTPRSYDVYNLYGPLESSVYVTARKLVEADLGTPNIPIGKPTAKNRVYLADGELCVSGNHLALGYLNNPEETARKFVPNPYYDPNTDEPFYSRMYRTGDMAEMMEDGNYLYCGRIDNQVKINGCRIEPGEIEIALMKHPDLSAASVVAKYAADGEPFLAAYYVPCGKGVSVESLKAFLMKSLPLYMIPRRFTMLESLPLNPRTNKVDKSALPD